jgi:hypothetical protein
MRTKLYQFLYINKEALPLTTCRERLEIYVEEEFALQQLLEKGNLIYNPKKSVSKDVEGSQIQLWEVWSEK